MREGESFSMPSEKCVVVKKRPAVLESRTHKIKLEHCGNMYATVTRGDSGEPLELFVNLGKCGGCQGCLLRGISRLASIALRAGVDKADVANALRGLHCPLPTYNNGAPALSCLALIADALDREGR